MPWWHKLPCGVVGCGRPPGRPYEPAVRVSDSGRANQVAGGGRAQVAPTKRTMGCCFWCKVVTVYSMRRGGRVAARKTLDEALPRNPWLAASVPIIRIGSLPGTSGSTPLGSIFVTHCVRVLRTPGMACAVSSPQDRPFAWPKLDGTLE